MRRGTKYDLANTLMTSITPRTRRADIIKLVKTYWEHPDNKAARQNYPDDATFGIKLAEFRSTDILIEKAKINCDYYDALKNRLLSIVESNEVITDTYRKALIFLLTSGRPNNKRKKTQASFHKGLQLALCVNAIDKGTNSKFSLTSPDRVGASTMSKNLFVLIAEATNEDENCVHKAWKDNKKLCRSQRMKK